MLFLNFFECITNGPPDLLRVSGRSRACGHCLFLLRASTKAQRAGQNGHNHDRFQKFQCISPPFPAGCCRSSRQGSWGTQRFSRPFLELAAVGALLTNDDRRAFDHEIEQFDHVVISHAYAAVTIGRADLVLVFRPMDINETSVGVRIMLP